MLREKAYRVAYKKLYAAAIGAPQLFPPEAQPTLKLWEVQVRAPRARKGARAPERQSVGLVGRAGVQAARRVCEKGATRLDCPSQRRRCSRRSTFTPMTRTNSVAPPSRCE
eukprot:4767905-Prymnesium_polylepis.2